MRGDIRLGGEMYLYKLDGDLELLSFLEGRMAVVVGKEEGNVYVHSTSELEEGELVAIVGKSLDWESLSIPAPSEYTNHVWL